LTTELQSILIKLHKDDDICFNGATEVAQREFLIILSRSVLTVLSLSEGKDSSAGRYGNILVVVQLLPCWCKYCCD
jgi:hypothetical protein